MPVVLKPGVEVHGQRRISNFVPGEFNTVHTKFIARSEKAKPMAVNMYSGILDVGGLCRDHDRRQPGYSPKPDAELKNLVMGLTPIPDEGPCPWYEKPLLWAGIVGAS